MKAFMRAAFGSAIVLTLFPGFVYAAPLVGGNRAGDGDVIISNITGSLSQNAADPDAEKLAQTRLPSGKISKLKVNVFFPPAPNPGGNGAFMVRLNGANTALGCSVITTGKTASCSSNAVVNVPNNGRLDIRLTNTSGNGNSAYFNYAFDFQ